MPTRNEKIEFIRDLLRQARVRECIGKPCKECKFYDTPNCLETCYATELVDMGIVQLPAEKQNAPEAETIDLSDKQAFSPIGPAILKEMPDDSFADAFKGFTNSLETYVGKRLETYANTVKRQSQSFFIADGNGQYHDEQYVSVTVLDHVLSLFSGIESE